MFIKNFKNILVAIFLITLANSCSKRIVDIKSPCVANGIITNKGASKSPCGPRIPVNQWWMINTLENTENTITS